MKREEKEEMNRDEKEVKQLRLSSLFTAQWSLTTANIHDDER